MNPADYIQSELQRCAHYELSDQDAGRLESLGYESFIYQKLTSKKFRKWSIDPASQNQIKQAIKTAVSQNKPIQFRFPFGGYKLWRLPGSPEVDWAEFFAIAYYCRYLAPVAAVYEPGIELLFTSDDVIIERMDNIPKADTDAYFTSFRQLLGAFQKYLPKNFTMGIVRIGDLYEDKQAMEQELAENVERFKKIYETEVDDDKKAQVLTTSRLNVRLDGVRDLTKLSPAEQEAVIAMGPIYHDAYCALQKRRAFIRGENKIVIFTTPISNAIAIGTTKASVTKFWTGYGMLEESGDTFKARIISPKQLAALDQSQRTFMSTDLVGLRNFKQLEIYQGTL